MAIQFDISKVAMFRNAVLANGDTMANLDGNGGIKSAGQYAGRFSDYRNRTDTQRTNNNAVRTALLKALGQAFGISGTTEEGGIVRFSAQFMNRLQQILGNDVLKRSDFKMSDDGMVKSGRPLTKRRIEAIINKAITVGKTDFDVDIYSKKLQTIKKELGLGEMPKDGLEKKTGKELFLLVEKGLDLLKNGIFLGKTVMDKETNKPVMVYGPKGGKVDKSFFRVNPNYLGMLESNMDPKKHGYSEFEVLGANGMYVPYDGNMKDELLKKLTFNEFIHTEHAPVSTKDLGSVENQKRYIYNTVQQFVQKMIDIYFEAKETGKLGQFKAFLSRGVGACLEAKGENLVKWQAENLKEANPANGEEMSKEEIAEFERVADLRDSDFAPPPKTDDLVYGVINSLYMTDDSFKVKDNWKDFAGPAKEKLLGKTAQIMNIELDEASNEYKFTPLLDLNNQPVVRPLTEEDIDEMGRACLKNVVG